MLIFQQGYILCPEELTCTSWMKVLLSIFQFFIATNSDRIITSINEFNRVMGGGIVKDSITILAAKPGAGKSTLLLQVANDLANKNYKVLYASGEESESQIKSRADRILDKIHPHVWVISHNSMDNVLESIEEIDPDL